MSDSQSTTVWVTVAEAAEKAQVDSGTIRQWYRAGRVPTRRAEGAQGAFLVPLDLVMSLVNPTEEAAPPPSAEPSIEELAAVRDQLEFLRSQLAEETAENRRLKQQLQSAGDQRADLRTQLADSVDDRKGVEARLQTVEAELTQLRRAAARSSITDNSWLDEQTPAYESPVRRQAMAGSPAGPTPAEQADGPTEPFTEAPASDLTDLLAATRLDEGDGDRTDGPSPGAGGLRFIDDVAEDDNDEESRAIWTDEAPHPPLGESPDDLLPHSEKKGRFGKK